MYKFNLQILNAYLKFRYPEAYATKYMEGLYTPELVYPIQFEYGNLGSFSFYSQQQSEALFTTLFAKLPWRNPDAVAIVNTYLTAKDKIASIFKTDVITEQDIILFLQGVETFEQLSSSQKVPVGQQRLIDHCFVRSFIAAPIYTIAYLKAQLNPTIAADTLTQLYNRIPEKDKALVDVLLNENSEVDLKQLDQKKLLAQLALSGHAKAHTFILKQAHDQTINYNQMDTAVVQYIADQGIDSAKKFVVERIRFQYDIDDLKFYMKNQGLDTPHWNSLFPKIGKQSGVISSSNAFGRIMHDTNTEVEILDQVNSVTNPATSQFFKFFRSLRYPVIIDNVNTYIKAKNILREVFTAKRITEQEIRKMIDALTSIEQLNHELQDRTAFLDKSYTMLYLRAKISPSISKETRKTLADKISRSTAKNNMLYISGDMEKKPVINSVLDQQQRQLIAFAANRNPHNLPLQQTKLALADQLIQRVHATQNELTAAINNFKEGLLGTLTNEVFGKHIAEKESAMTADTTEAKQYYLELIQADIPEAYPRLFNIIPDQEDKAASELLANKNHAPIYFSMGEFYRHRDTLRDWQKSLAFFMAVPETDNNYLTALYEAGQLAASKLNNPDEAHKIFEKLLETATAKLAKATLKQAEEYNNLIADVEFLLGRKDRPATDNQSVQPESHAENAGAWKKATMADYPKTKKTDKQEVEMEQIKKLRNA